MLSHEQRSKIKEKLKQKLKELNTKGKFSPQVSMKQDMSIVTEVDHFLSELVKQETSNEVCFYSEEDHSSLTFPAVILDPIDGTIEFAQGIPECSLSYAWMPSAELKSGEAWLYNPFTGFEIASDMIFSSAPKSHGQRLLGLVSRSEFERGFFREMELGLIQISPRGSIAFKLGLLASGACDFVVSKRSKNIWDIAGGTILLYQRGFVFYENGVKLDKLDKATYEAPLLWCREKDFTELTSTLKL